MSFYKHVELHSNTLKCHIYNDYTIICCILTDGLTKWKRK